jgi:cystatin-11
MGRHWQAPHLLLAILVALVSFTYQARRKTFIRVQEENAVETQVKDTLQYATDMYNKDSDDKYNFRILRILKIEKQVSGWLLSSLLTTPLHPETTGAPEKVPLH